MQRCSPRRLHSACGSDKHRGAFLWLRSLLVGPVVHTNRVRVTYPCGLAMVVFQQPAEPFVTLNRSFTLSGSAWSRKEQGIALTLMWAFLMKMGHIFLQGSLGRGVTPAMWTRRLSKCLKNNT